MLRNPFDFLNIRFHRMIFDYQTYWVFIPSSQNKIDIIFIFLGKISQLTILAQLFEDGILK